MLPWLKVSAAVVRIGRDARIAEGRAASDVEALAEISLLMASGEWAAGAFKAQARALGWSPGKLARRLDSWRSADLLHHETDEPQAVSVTNRRRTAPTEEQPALSRRCEPQANRSRTDDGPPRALPLLIEEEVDSEAPSSTEDTPTPGREKMTNLKPDTALKGLNLIRLECHAAAMGTTPNARGLSLTVPRRRDLARAIPEVRKLLKDREEPHDAEAVLRALETGLRWLYTSDAYPAQGARKTGEPLNTLLRTKCASYVEAGLLAKEERPAGTVDLFEQFRQGVGA